MIIFFFHGGAPPPSNPYAGQIADFAFFLFLLSIAFALVLWLGSMSNRKMRNKIKRYDETIRSWNEKPKSAMDKTSEQERLIEASPGGRKPWQRTDL